MPDMGNEPESAAGGRLPRTAAERATGAQVLAIAAGILAMASGLLMLRSVGYTAANLGTGVSFVPDSITWWSVWLAVGPAGAAAVAAVAGLALRGRARWLRYLQVGLWLLALASSVYIAGICAPFTSPAPVAAGDIAGVVTVIFLTLSLRRPAGRQPGWHVAFVLAAVALLLTAVGRGAAYQAYGPDSGILTGIVAQCSPAAEKAAGDLDPSRVVIVSVQNQAGQTVASQRLPLRRSGARYRMRLPRGTYSINADSGPGPGHGSVGDTVYVPADQANEEDFNGPDGCVS
jgi:hypothetical protein